MQQEPFSQLGISPAQDRAGKSFWTNIYLNSHILISPSLSFIVCNTIGKGFCLTKLTLFRMSVFFSEVETNYTVVE